MPKYSQNIREIRNFAKQNLFCNNFAMFREFCKENHFSSFSHNVSGYIFPTVQDRTEYSQLFSVADGL